MQASGSSDEPLICAVDDGVMTVTLNRPDKLNALDDAMMEGLRAAIARVAADDAVRVMVLTGAGKGFCSGADTGRFDPGIEVTPVTVKARLQNGLQRIPMALSELDKPVIAAVNGAAAGAGMDLALMCDLRFAGRSMRMTESYARLGLVPGAGGAFFLPRIVGAAKALELLWSAEFVDADEALRVGLVNRVYPDEELVPRTLEFARRLAHSPPLSIRLIKRAVYQGLASDLKTGLDLVASYLSIARTSRDHAEAAAAFREKRAGRYEGR